MIKCEIDNKEFKNGGVLARYLKSKYSLTYKEYYHKYILKLDEIPKCKCGCGKEIPWSNVGYREYVKGHYSRIHNNWGHNPKAIEKSSETRRRQYANGQRKVWNYGLTKEMDERVMKNIEKSTNTINSNPNEIKRRSMFMKEQRKNGSLPTLYGSQSSQWKGGVSEVNNITRSNKRLYDEWKYPILIRDEFKCKECGNSEKLHIHHDKEPMCEIIKKHMPDMEYITDFELKKSIAEKIVDYHIKNKVSGITLCYKCHENYHPSLNFG